MIKVVLFFVFILAVYLNNATRDVYSGDIGDLVTGAFVFGIAHPPGYPLLTLLGFIFTHLPFPVPVVTKMAYVSVLASIIGLIFFYVFSLRATKSRLIAFFATSILAFSYPFWIQTEIPEVFALSHSLLILIFFFAIRFYEERKPKYLYLTLFFMGLSLTNQQAIIAVFPSIALLLCSSFWETLTPALSLRERGKKSSLSFWERVRVRVKRARMTVLLKGLGAFFLGLLPYIYVPIAALTNPQINWLGGETTFQNFIRLILRTAYPQAYPFEENAVGIIPRFIALKIYSQNFIDQYSIIVVLLCIIGILALLKNKKLLLLSLLSGFIISGPLFIYVIFPPINDPEQFRVLERFYTHSFIVFLFLMPFGLQFIAQLIQFILRAIRRSQVPSGTWRSLRVEKFSRDSSRLRDAPSQNHSIRDWGVPTGTAPSGASLRSNNKGRRFTSQVTGNLFLLPLFIIPFVLFLQNFPRTNLSKTQIGNNLARDILNQLPPNAAVFLRTDSVIFNTWYLHFVLGLREDVAVNVPREKKDDFLQEIFEKKRPIFFTHREIIEHPRFVLIPDGLLLHLIQKNKIPSKEEFISRVNSQLRLINVPKRSGLTPAEKNLLTPTITRFYSLALSRIGNFINLTYDDATASIPFYKLAIEIDHEYSLGYAGLGYAYFQISKDCSLSKKIFEQASSLSPFHRSYYVKLYQILKECKAGKDIEYVKKSYQRIFKRNIDDDLYLQDQFFSDT